MNELWVPQNLEASEEILTRHQTRRLGPADRDWEEKLGFYNAQENRWWFVESYNLVTAEMVRPYIVWVRPDGSRLEILAETGTYSAGVWAFTNVHVLEYSGEAGSVPQQIEREALSMPVFSETPERIRSEIKINKLNSFKSVRKAQLSIREILEYQR